MDHHDQWSEICLSHGASKQLMNLWPVWIHWFLWCTMIQTDLGSLILIRITPKEHSLHYGLTGASKNLSGLTVRWIALSLSPCLDFHSGLYNLSRTFNITWKQRDYITKPCSLLWFLLLKVITITNKFDRVGNLGKNHLLLLVHVHWPMVFTERKMLFIIHIKILLPYPTPQNTSLPPMLMQWLHLVDCQALWGRHRFLLANQVLQRTDKNTSCLICAN